MCLNYGQCSCNGISFDISKYQIVGYHKGKGNTNKGQKSKFSITDETQLILFANMARNGWYEIKDKKIYSFGIYIQNNKCTLVGDVDKQGDIGAVCIVEYDADMNQGIWHAYPSSVKGETIPTSILEKWKEKGYITAKQFKKLNCGAGLYL